VGELAPVVREALLDRDDEVAGVDEGGEDVVYIAADTGASGSPSLYRYEFNLSGNDVVERVGVMGLGQAAYQGTATVDSTRGWFVRTLWPG
jgi:hypothetical protein